MGLGALLSGFCSRAGGLDAWIPGLTPCPALPCRLFLSRGADTELRNKEGDSPLDLTLEHSDVWVALQLNRKIRQGAASRGLRTERIISRWAGQQGVGEGRGRGWSLDIKGTISKWVGMGPGPRCQRSTGASVRPTHLDHVRASMCV